MLYNWIKTAYRNLLNQKIYSLINILGLSISLASVLLILFWINYEISYDQFNDKVDRIYHLGYTTYYETGNMPTTSCPPLLAKEIKKSYPEVEQVARRIGSYRNIFNGESSFHEYIYCIDKEIFDILSFTIEKQLKQNFLDDIHSVAISTTMAKKFFGENTAIGKQLIINKTPFTVTAVFKDIPKNTSTKLNICIPFDNAKSDGHKLTHWGYSAYETLVLLKKGTNISSFNEKIKNSLSKHRDYAKIETWLFPYKDTHLYGVFGDGKIRLIYLFSFIAFFILLIGCINYMNLTTARSAIRSKEIGLRKVVGANKQSIIKQFYIETVLMTTISFIIANLIAYILLPYFNTITNSEITYNISSRIILVSSLSIWGLSILISGAYPALYLSSFKPAIIIKGILNRKKSAINFRKALVIFQFSMSIILIVFTLIIFSQISFIKNKDWGFNKDNILYIRTNPEKLNKFDVFRSDLKQNANIKAICQSSHLPSYINSSMDGITWQDQNIEYKNAMNFTVSDADLKDCINLKMVHGRYFDDSYGTDSSKIVINETACKIMGFKNPIGKWVRPGGSSTFKIVGVCKDFHFNNFKNEIKPLIIFKQWYYRYIIIKLTQNNIPETIKFIEDKWSEANPETAFEYTLLSDSISRHHRDEDRLITILKLFAIIAIIISALGLLGLSSYMAQQKTKEIGIRRVLGSSTQQITFTLSKQFIKWVILANVISWPIAFYLGSRFLDNYVYRTNISIWVFILTGIFSILIAQITISYQSIKAANTKIVYALRHK